MKLMTVIGARPQFVKAAVVSHALASAGIEEVLVHTGQHFDKNMSDVFFDELGMSQPAHNLGIGGGSHGENTGRMIEAIEKLLVSTRPDGVLVFGDTDSTLAAALAAVKVHCPVAHVEAGLRSFNRRMPEEINRVLTDHASDLLFAPTDGAVANLIKEGVDQIKVKLVGDVMYDAALHYGQVALEKSSVLTRLGLDGRNYVLATVHRAENTDDASKLKVIVDALSSLGLPCVLPVHPRTRKKMSELNLCVGSNVILIDPVGYLDMVRLEKSADLILTDSGGVQKEAFFHRIPCVTLRGETEWTELVAAGWNVLCPPDSVDAVVSAVESSRKRLGSDIAPYGRGDASNLIAIEILAMRFG